MLKPLRLHLHRKILVRQSAMKILPHPVCSCQLQPPKQANKCIQLNGWDATRVSHLSAATGRLGSRCSSPVSKVCLSLLMIPVRRAVYPPHGSTDLLRHRSDSTAIPLLLLIAASPTP